MKKILIASIAAAAFCGTPAIAADMPVKAPVVAPWSWTGFYIGANAGYSWGRSNTTEMFTDAAGAALFTNSGAFSLDGAIGGGQIGYNWQDHNWVFGLEADIQFSGQKGDGNFACPSGVCSIVGGAAGIPQVISGTLDQKLKWFGTLRPRAGVLVTPDTLALSALPPKANPLPQSRNVHGVPQRTSSSLRRLSEFALRQSFWLYLIGPRQCSVQA
jgi:outer membrane immunogenic protein